MAISKNNPNVRSNEKLLVFCNVCGKEVKIVKQVTCEGNSLMLYKCLANSCEFTYPVLKGSYKDLKHEWISKKK